jgi:hypothetical protein
LLLILVRSTKYTCENEGGKSKHRLILSDAKESCDLI